ncbi:hypothetical protein BDZ90DRAFT_267601 [Jaminaea rosea]|uniref:Cytoplasmic protein n=1 Tax=Jaminaea rosea TaxID=1569628 RepID=A0A316ULE0_9BASI|nr:hypothetical protein BDZ90DRAFT_267601 [Jaminaea rosea]PWN26077.1 hypothetical protein BDZ90DRAFT_267601 [Jaminaea rosea]
MADPAPQSSTSESTAPPSGESDATRSPTPPGGFHAYKPVLSSDDFLSSTETNLARPLTDATITIRVIKSFPYRSVKNLVLNHIDLTKMTVLELEERCRKDVSTLPAFKAFRTHAPKLDCLKIYTRAHGAKTTNLIINLDHPEWLLDDAENRSKTLQEVGLENEAEVSIFNREDYEAFLKDPTTTW